jgi:hypothetical protein
MEKGTVLNVFEGYEPNNIYNTDETGLFFRLPLNKTLSLKGDPCNGGKNFKDRIMVLLACSADGTDKPPPLVIGKSENRHCFKNVTQLPTKYVANRKAWVTQAIFTDYLRALDAKMSSQNRKILLFLDQCAYLQDTSFLKNVKVVFFSLNCTSVLQPLDQGIIRSFKHYYRKQLVRKTIHMIDHKLLLDATLMKVNILDALHFIAESWRCVTHTIVVNCFQKYGFNLNQTNDAEDVTELSIAENEWGKLKAGVSFKEYVCCDDNVVRSEVQTLEQMMDEKFTSGVCEEEEDDCEKVNLQQHFCLHWMALTL